MENVTGVKKMAEILTNIYEWMTVNYISWSFNGYDFNMTWWSVFVVMALISLAIFIVEKILG